MLVRDCYMEIKICAVCFGKGGWKKGAVHPWDDTFQDCHFCNGLGFYKYDGETEEDKNFIPEYTKYKEEIISLLNKYGKVDSFETSNLAQTIEINFVAKERDKRQKDRLADFIKLSLKMGAYSRRLGIEIQKVYFYEPDNDMMKHYWRFKLEPKELEDLDGFIDLIELWEV